MLKKYKEVRICLRVYEKLAQILGLIVYVPRHYSDMSRLYDNIKFLYITGLWPAPLESHAPWPITGVSATFLGVILSSKTKNLIEASHSWKTLLGMDLPECYER